MFRSADVDIPLPPTDSVLAGLPAMLADQLEMQLSLPSYSEAQATCAPVPSYSPEPACGEERLNYSARVQRRNVTPTGKMTLKSGSTQVVLDNQDCVLKTPSYGRSALVSGTVNLLGKREDITHVELKLHGRLELIISESGAETKPLMDETYAIWSDSDPCPSNQCGFAPSSLPFSFILPSEYRDGEKKLPIPPSYEGSFIGVPALFAKALYSLTVVVHKSPKFGFIPKIKRMQIPIHYHPRSRPFRPVLQETSFLSTIKVAPDEWFESQAVMQRKTNAQPNPVHTNFFIPSSKVYTLGEPIPFHIQLSGSCSSLIDFLPPSYSDSLTNPTSPPSFISRKRPTRIDSIKEPKIRVYIMRQTVVEVRGVSSWRYSIIGEGEVSALPPVRNCDCETKQLHLDWAGEVSTNEDVTVGGFSAGENLTVKDFIVLNILPSCNSSLSEMKLPVSVRLVTDSWIEVTGHDVSS